MTTAKTKKAKGQALENFVADRLVDKGIDHRAKRDGASGAGNREKADVSTSMQICGENVHIECKNHAKASIKEWWRQTVEGSEMTHTEPLLVYKLGGEGVNQNDVKIVMRLETLLELVLDAEGMETEKVITVGESKSLRYKGESLVRCIREYAKELQAIENIEL
ncbi:hypothetical protein KAU11_10390 [Candidatus Babeliales bacterium]|nr:hypothetical protein [Candidatus Babeliales bacterium]